MNIGDRIIENGPAIIGGFSILQYILQSGLNVRQIAFLARNGSPSYLSDIIDHEEAKKAHNYSREKLRLSVRRGLWSTAVDILSLYVRLDARLYMAVSNRLPGGHAQHPYVSLALFLAASGMLEGLISLPWDVYTQFGLEAKWGFNKTSARTFVSDFFVNYAIELVMTVVLLLALSVPLSYAGRWAWAPAAVLVALLIFVIQAAMPFILALKNKLTPLPEGELRTQLESAATHSGFMREGKPARIVEIDGSRRSGHSNAFAGGVGRGRTVALFDTLLTQCTQDEALAVAAHELGHQHHHHVLYLSALNVTAIATLMALVSRAVFAPTFYQSLGFPTEALVDADGQTMLPLALGLNYAISLAGPVSFIFSILINVLSRRFEYQADDYAVRELRCRALPAALVRIHTENLAAADADPLYAACVLTHPPLVHRLRAMEGALGGEDAMREVLKGVEPAAESEPAAEPEPASAPEMPADPAADAAA